MGIPFFNCPIRGVNVIVSIDQIIGGVQGAGQGWRMLMESLAEGRAISLPAMSTGGVKYAARVVSSYAAVRKQFGVSIDKLEGVQEVIGRIGAQSYMMEAMRIFTAGAVDSGLKPAVISAIAKYHSTETLRRVFNDAMDILGGAGISRGPSNLLGNGYISLPIGITVEGANILTRTMIIFGQGALRCHPCAYHELKALNDKNVTAFDRAFFSHLGFVVQNFCRGILLSLTRGHLASVPPNSGPLKRYFQKLSWSSAVYAFMSDLAMGTLGGGLKQKERLTGRYADILSWMYIASAVARRFIAEGQNKEHLPFVRWCMDHALLQIQHGFDGIFRNFIVPIPGVGGFLRWIIAPWSHFNSLGSGPNDKDVEAIAKAMARPGPLRDLVSSGVFLPTVSSERMAVFELAFSKVIESEALAKKIRQAVKDKKIEKKIPSQQQIAKAVDLGVLTAKEAETMQEAERLRDEVIRVDSFKLTEYTPNLLESRS
jgi:acyl-CoA dehydrogenase